MTDSPRSSIENSLSIRSPQITIRRPADPLATNPTTPHSNPYPREAISNSLQIATPVMITPVERSTRDIIRVRPIRRIRRRQETGSIFNTIRRRLSMATPGETTSEFQMFTPRTLPRSKRIDKTSTAIELEPDQFQMILSEFRDIQIHETDLTNVPSDSSNCAKLREINRLEAIDVAISALNTDCEDRILEAVELLEWNIGQMTAETASIDQILDEFEEEMIENRKKWEQIEHILNILRVQ